MPLIDVVMPVRNGGRYLQRALDSLAAQTLGDFRLVICDDGSSDDTPSIIGAETRFPVIAIRHEEKRGIARSLNELIELSSDCTYIARFDADDECMPDRFERQVGFLVSHPEVGIVGSAMTVIDGEGRSLGVLKYPSCDEEIRLEMLFSDPLAHPALMLRASIFKDPTNLYDPDSAFVEDYELWSRLFRVTRFANISDPLVNYRRHSQAVGVRDQQEQEPPCGRCRSIIWLDCQSRRRRG